MSATKDCQASIPANCKYHGVSSVPHTRMLKNKLLVATQTYQALKGTPQSYIAYSSLREAQNDYYATNQGMAEIENAISRKDLTEEQYARIDRIHQTAIDTRLAHEHSVTALSAFIPPPKRYKSLPEAVEDTNRQAKNISTFSGPSGALMTIDYIEEDKLIIVNSKDRERIVIGQASSIEEATYKATSWYNMQN